MTWLDLWIICLLLWGAVSGYLAGWKSMACRLVMIVLTTAMAVLFQGDMKEVLVRDYAVHEVIKAAIYSRLAVPVDSASISFSSVLNQLGVHPFLHHTLLKDLLPASVPDFGLLVDLLAQIMLNAVAFLAVLTLWWGAVYLVISVWAGRRNENQSKQPGQWVGAVVGSIGQFLQVTLVIGVLTPLIWLYRLPPELLNLEDTILARWGLQLFNSLGIWWR
jgi:hypothetical protein